MTQFSFNADPGHWQQVDPGTDPVQYFAQWDDTPASPWKLLLSWHAEWALRWANGFGSAAWLLADEPTGIAAAVAPLAADGPEEIAGMQEAVALVERLVDRGIADPLVSEASFAGLGGYAVTQVHELPPELAEMADEGAMLQMLQTVFVAADGAGNVVYAAVSPQLSNMAGYVLLPVAAALETARWHD